jgi:hypothetical protein
MVMTIVNGVKFNLVSKINNNELEVSTLFVYGDKEYYINKIEYGTNKDVMWSISEKRIFGSSMNLGKITSKYISLYTYDMMSNLTTYKMAVEEMIFEVE